jgi:hypothetical protein
MTTIRSRIVRPLIFFSLVLLAASLMMPAASAAAPMEVTITKLASDDTTVLDEKTVSWTWMRDNLPVLGDGITTYYNQGPIFEGAWEEVHPGEPYDLWNPTEDVNLEYKDHGEFKGTNVRDLCDLVGGASEGDMVTIKASDGLTKTWPAEYIYSPDPRQGPMVIAWYHGTDTGYVNERFYEGMRLYFLVETTNADGMLVWGNYDMHEAWDEEYWYFYNNQYPSAVGNSVQKVNRITIHSQIDPTSGSGGGSDGGRPASRGFEGSTLVQDLHGAVNGTLTLLLTGGNACWIEGGSSCRWSLDTTGLNLTGDAHLYLFGTNNTGTVVEGGSGIEATLGTRTLKAASHHLDTGDGPGGAAETWRYDLPSEALGANQTLTITNPGRPGTGVTVYGGALAAQVAGGENLTAWWIAEGADTVQAVPDQGISEDDAVTVGYFDDLGRVPEHMAAKIVAVSTGATGNDTLANRLSLNDGEWLNLLSAGRDAISVGEADAVQYLRAGENRAAISSVPYGEPGDLLENRLLILTLTHLPEEEIVEETPTGTTPAPRTTTLAAPTPAAETVTGTADEAGDLSFLDAILRLFGMERGLADLPIIGWLFEGAPAGPDGRTVEPGPTAADPSGEEQPHPPVTPDEMPTHASISIVTHPAGAMVTLDGAYLGVITPVDLHEIPVGQHTLHLDLIHYAPYETSFDLDGDTSVAVALSPQNPNINENPLCLNLAAMQGADGRSGGLFVAASDDGAEIYIDGKKIGKTTPQVVNGLKEGLHRVKIRMGSTKYLPDTIEVWVTPGTITPVYFDRSVNGASRTLTIDDPAYTGEFFSVNGIYAGKSVPSKVTVTGINAFAGIFHEGAYLSAPISDFAADGSTIRLEKPSPVLRSVMVVSDPPGARIFVDGFDTGLATPSCIDNISAGYHRFMLAKPGYLSEDALVLLPERLDNREISLKLEPYPYGYLYVNSTPAGAKIYLYDLNTGEVTPHLFRGVALGTYDVKVVGRSESKTLEDLLVKPHDITVCEWVSGE